jgi:hypothetical protein
MKKVVIAVIDGSLGSWSRRSLARLRRMMAITYSQKASTHRAVHPYLRYGIMLGDLFAQEEITKL